MPLYVKLPKAIWLGLLLCCSASQWADAKQAKDNPRIISAGGSITEILFALDLGDKVVGVDSSSLYPERATQLPQVGYFRSLGAEGLMSLSPDIIIAAKGAGPSAVLKQVNKLGIEVRAYDQHSYTLEAWKELITELGRDYSKTNEAAQLIGKVTQGLSGQLQQRRYQQQQLNALVLLSIGQRGPIVAGNNTVPKLLLTLAGINNLAYALDGYKPFSSELMATGKLDLVLIPSHVIASLGGEKAVCDNQIIKLAMDGDCNIHVMDPLLLMGFGARLDQAVGEIIGRANKL